MGINLEQRMSGERTGIRLRPGQEGWKTALWRLEEVDCMHNRKFDKQMGMVIRNRSCGDGDWD